MAKRFNVTGPCIPEKHYMVDLTERTHQIREMVQAGDYFTINRARQYGKTTTMAALERALDEAYLVISLDFQALGAASFQDENTFCLAFLRLLLKELGRKQAEKLPELEETCRSMGAAAERREPDFYLLELFEHLSDLCARSPKPVVLMIDEVDSASNNQVFLDFLAQLRLAYLQRDVKGAPAFQSVILAGVYDIRNLKRKLRPDEGRKVNSPWNIAADFNVSMELTEPGIRGMLQEYERDHPAGMDTEEMAVLLYNYTSGYPYLVSRLCRLMEERICAAEPSERGTQERGKQKWTREGFLEAVRMLLSEQNMLFESLAGKLADYPELNRMLKDLLFLGKPITYSPARQPISLALMFGFVKKEDGNIRPANRIFDTFLYDYFLSQDELQAEDIYKASLQELQDRNQFVTGGQLDMRRVLEKFTEHFHQICGHCTERFLEDQGRRYFLLYLRPIINGVGNYYIESQTRSLGRTDIIVDFAGFSAEISKNSPILRKKCYNGNETKNYLYERRVTWYGKQNRRFI